MRWFLGVLLVVAATASPAAAEPNWQCTTVATTLRPEPREFCEENCPLYLETERNSGVFVSGTECTAAPDVLWCYDVAEANFCFRSKELCEDAEPRLKAHKIAKLPRPDIDPCREKRIREAPAPEVAAVVPDAAAEDLWATTVPDRPRPPNILIAGSFLFAGDEPTDSKGGVLGVEYRSAGTGLVSLARGFDAELHYSSGERGLGGRIAARVGLGVNLGGGGSLGLTAGIAYGGVERSAAELPFELFVNGSVLGVGVMMRYEQVHRFVDDVVMPGGEEPRFMNASGFSMWAAIVGGARHPLACVGFKLQERDGTDAAFLSVAVGAPAPAFF